MLQQLFIYCKEFFSGKGQNFSIKSHVKVFSVIFTLFISLYCYLECVDVMAKEGENPDIIGNYFQKYYFDEIFMEPNIKLTSMDFNNIALKEKRGKFLVLYFFATWCSSCSGELKMLEKLKKNTDFLDLKDMEIVPISVDYKSVEHIDAFFKELGISELGYFMDNNKHAMSALKVKSLPSTFFVDKEGYIFAKIEHNVSWSKKEVLESFMHMVLDVEGVGQREGKKYFGFEDENALIFNKKPGNLKRVTIIE